MGRNNNRGHSNNKSSLPQTPKNQKIAANQVQEEFSEEISELSRAARKSSSSKNKN